MKRFFFVIIITVLFFKVSFGQEINIASDHTYTINKMDVVNDEGHWFGFRFGIQTKPSVLKRGWKYSEWWTFIVMYEYRFDRIFSLLAEYHRFNEKYLVDREKSAIEIGLKSRFHILNKFRISAEAGLAFAQIAPAIPLFYGGSIEFELNKKISAYINIRTFIIPDFGYWLTLGINYNLSNVYY